MRTLMMLLAIFLAGCKTVEYVPVETKVTETVTVRDTAVIAKLVEYHDTIASPDTLSHIVNAYAESWAKWEGGLLSHSLSIRPGACLIVQVPQYIERTKEIEVPKVKEVEKPLSLRQKVLIKLGTYSAFSLVVCIVLLILILWIRRKGGSRE